MSEECKSTQSLLEQDFMLPILAYGFRWAVKDCLKAAGLPDNPVTRVQPYEGEQFQRLDVEFRHREEVCLTTTVTMRVSKARSKCSGVSDFDAAVRELYETVSLEFAEYFATPGNTIGACNYPDEKSNKFVGIRWNGLIIKMTFRAETGTQARLPEANPRDPMEPFSESL